MSVVRLAAKRELVAEAVAGVRRAFAFIHFSDFGVVFWIMQPPVYPGALKHACIVYW
eukprot:SAG11_NODE_1091_length_5910_cov_4.332817_5_plen_57_part_00